MMIGVAMGMTSEEPVTHLTWFTDLLLQASLSPSEHLLVLTLVGSSLDKFARAHQIPSHPLQLDGGTGIEGRMSAPTTRVFLLPVALYLVSLDGMSGQLRNILSQAWHLYNLEQATHYPDKHPFVQLACALSEASINGICHFFIELPETWVAIGKWIEQVFEQSSGKNGKGVVVFPTPQSAFLDSSRGSLSLRVVAERRNAIPAYGMLTLPEMVLPYLDAQDPLERLAAVATMFLGWQLCTALYCYLQEIPFAGEPAVEWYKQRVRELRTQPSLLQAADNWSDTVVNDYCCLFAPPHVREEYASPGVFFARTLQAVCTTVDKQNCLRYLDFTYNGESSSLFAILTSRGKCIADRYMHMPVKVRRAPAEYHVSEQSELDGPRDLISLRIMAREHAQCILGIYSDEFLCAQAVGTWQVINEQGRPCFLLVLNEPADEALERFFCELENELAHTVVGVNGLIEREKVNE